MDDFVAFWASLLRRPGYALTFSLIPLMVASVRPAAAQSLGASEPPAQRPDLQLAQAASRSPQTFHQMLFVNPLTGDDQRGEGSLRSPFRSITRAVQFAEPDTVILLSMGTYDRRSGEQFPIMLPPGVSLMNDPAASGPIVVAGEVVQDTTAMARSTPVASPAPMALPPQPVAVVTAPVEVSPARPRPVETVIPVPDAISIPVPPPEGLTPTPVVSEPSAPIARLPNMDAPIDIPVPPPANPLPQARPAPSIQMAIAASSPYDLLPVPDLNIPLGYTGDLPRVAIPNRGEAVNISQGAGGTVSRGTGGLRYRVLVRAESDQVRSWVQSVVPGAFETTSDGESMMQIGAFQNLENAEAAADQLNRNGIRATIEEWR